MIVEYCSSTVPYTLKTSSCSNDFQEMVDESVSRPLTSSCRYTSRCRVPFVVASSVTRDQKHLPLQTLVYYRRPIRKTSTVRGPRHLVSFSAIHDHSEISSGVKLEAVCIVKAQADKTQCTVFSPCWILPVCPVRPQRRTNLYHFRYNNEEPGPRLVRDEKKHVKQKRVIYWNEFLDTCISS